MLQQLHISNLVVVEHASLELGPGLNVITGSTGAGKSLIVGAVNLLLGHRARPELIRAGCDRASVRARFALPHGGTAGNGVVEVMREIRNNGRSYAFIDGRSVSVRDLGELASRHIEPHAQNEQAKLRDPGTHAGYLDSFAANASDREVWRAALGEFRAACQALESFDTRVALGEQHRELLAHRVAEVERAAPVAGERESLERARTVHESAERIATALSSAIECLYDGEGAALDVVSASRRDVGPLSEIDIELSAVASHLESAEVSISEAVSAMRSRLDGLEFDADEVERVRERLNLLQTLERRYGMHLDALIEAAGAWRAELDAFDSSDLDRRELLERTARARAALEAAGTALRASRVKAAGELDQVMTREIQRLGMRGAVFRTDIGSEPGGAHDPEIDGGRCVPFEDGADVIRFMVCPNPGESEGAVDRISSTGETSRIALALKAVTRREAPGALLVFDEIDSGIGADLGEVIAEKLLALARGHQIVCITHMPQIAAAARRHLVVVKESGPRRSLVRIQSVDDDARRNEIERMLGGEAGPGHTAALAEDLLRRGGAIR